jgi:hypothetical protein
MWATVVMVMMMVSLHLLAPLGRPGTLGVLYISLERIKSRLSAREVTRLEGGCQAFEITDQICLCALLTDTLCLARRIRLEPSED